MSLLDQIELLETLGEGSFGVVCLVRLEEGPLRRTVVLKVLKESWSEDERVLTRARDEARLLALLNHDNIVKVERLETVGKKTVVVMEYVQGLSLDLILANLGPMPVRVALQMIAKVAGALDAAYNRVPTGEARPLRVVHRDIKPSNIILSISGTVKVLDFGTARGSWESREARTETDVGMGTLLYMAPECFDEGQPGPEVDVYALGATLYELLSGVRLGRLSVDPSRHDAQRAQRVEQLQPIELMGYPKAMAAVREVVDRCIRYPRGERPSASELRQLCRQALYTLPTQRPTLDLYAETCVEPLWQRRPQRPPPSLAGTLDISGEVPIEAPTRPYDATLHLGRPSGQRDRNLAHAHAQPELARPGQGVTPVGEEQTQVAPSPRTRKPPASRASQPPDSTFVDPPPEADDADRGVAVAALIAFLCVLLGIGGVLGGQMMWGALDEGAPSALEAAELELEPPADEPGGATEAPPEPQGEDEDEAAQEDAPATATHTRRRATPAPSEPTQADEPQAEAPRAEEPQAERSPTEATPAAPKPQATPKAASTVTVDVRFFPIEPVRISGRSYMAGQRHALTVGGHTASVPSKPELTPCDFRLTEDSQILDVRPADGALRCAVR